MADFRSSGVLGSEYGGNQPSERVSALVNTLANQNTSTGSEWLFVSACVCVRAGLFSTEMVL